MGDLLKSPTCLEVAKSYKIWGEYVDSLGVYSEEAFESMTLQERLDVMRFCGWETDSSG